MISTPILVFSNFEDRTSHTKCENAYPIDLLEEELKKLLSNGYISVSIAQLNTAMTEKKNLPQKSFCLVFVGGYAGNYSVAFPVIQKLGIHVDMFIPNDLAGYFEYPGLPNFIPHFSWEQANIMKQSGLVDIYPMWHPFDEGKCLDIAIAEKTKQIAEKISGSSPNKSFWIDTNNKEHEKITALKKAGICSYLIPVLATTLERLKNGALPYIEVSSDKGILAAIEYFSEVFQNIVNREESIEKSQNLIIDWDNSEYSSIYLPVEPKPIIRNYLRHAIPLSILEADSKDNAELWVLNEYIDIVFRPWYHWYDYDNTLYDSWNVLICNTIHRDFIEANRINVVDSIIKGLTCGYCADVWLDSYYIPGKPAYNHIHLAHNVLVYGYDKSSDLFDALSYTTRGVYEHLSICPENLIRACSNEYFVRINFLKRNKETSIVYNTDHLLKKLKGYIKSEYEPVSYSKYTSYDKNQFINYEASLAFPNYLIETAEHENKIYMVALYGFLEHKKCMGWRLKYLANREHISLSYFEDYEIYSRQITEKILALGLKFQITNNKKILTRVFNLAEELNGKEKEAINRLLAILDNRGKR